MRHLVRACTPAARRCIALTLLIVSAAVVVACSSERPPPATAPPATATSVHAAAIDAEVATATPLPTPNGAATTPAPAPTPTPLVELIPSPTRATAVTAGPDTDPTPSAPAAERINAELARELDTIERSMLLILDGFAPPSDYTRSFMTPDELVAFLEEEFSDPETQAVIEAEERLFKLLGLIDPGLDLEAEYLGLYGTQVIGLYDEETMELYIVEKAGDATDLSALEEITYAHEYYHLLQDGKFDLGLLHDEAEGNLDRELALAALIEGDATVVESIYALRHLSPADISDLIAESGEQGPALAAVPYVLRRGLEFPYVDGAEFVAELYATARGDIDASYARPPLSTEQIIHPDRYFDGDAPRDVTMPELSNALGDGWSEYRRDVMGEFLLRTWLDAIGVELAADVAAAGWGGDSVVLLDGPDASRALGARIVWDDPAADGREFFDALRDGLAASDLFDDLGAGQIDDGPTQRWQGPAGTLTAIQLGDGSTAFAVAPSPDLATRLLAAIAASS